MNIKNIALLIAVGIVFGIGIALPVSWAVQGTKTVTKTQTVPAKITNGEALSEVRNSFGTPMGATRGGEQLPAGCAIWEGPKKSNGQPTWIIVAC